jgi:citrate lyase subunit beta/citryl-CoA lyase
MTFDLGPALLFCPADRPEWYGKAAERADAVILDLEDAVAPADRPTARSAMIEHPLDPSTTLVRVNEAGSADFVEDLAALAKTPYRMIMLPKAVGTSQLRELEDFDVVALCETAAGILAAVELAACRTVVALMWGAEDLVASLGGTSSRFDDGTYRDVARHARSAVLLAAAAHGKAAVDTVHLDIADLDGLAAEAQDAAAVGFAATACIHPGQVETIRTAYAPTDAEVAYAHDVLSAAAGTNGVFRFRGHMVDSPVLRHAEHTLRRAGLPPFQRAP